MDVQILKEMIRDELDEFFGPFKRKPKFDCGKVKAKYDEIRRAPLPLSNQQMYFMKKAEKYMKKHCPDLSEGIDEENAS